MLIVTGLLQLSIIFLASLAVEAAAADRFLCVADKITGFNYDKHRQQWRQADFAPSLKLVISRAKNETYTWTIGELGSDTIKLFCKNDFSDSGLLYCSGIGLDLRFNKKLMRFLYTYSIGYWDENAYKSLYPGRKEGDDTPAMAIGKCSPL